MGKNKLFCMMTVFMFTFWLILANCTSSGAVSGGLKNTGAVSADVVWDESYGGADKSYDANLLALREIMTPRFQERKFADAATGKTLTYNIFVPEQYNPAIKYPLVLFMPDATVLSKRAEAPMMQGYGAIIWATPESQAKNKAFVVAPVFERLPQQEGQTVHGPMAMRLLEDLMTRYSIDSDRLYTTGQSYGCMASFYLNAAYPDFFTASMYVSGQWDVDVLGPLANQKFFYITSEADPRAPLGMKALGDMLTGRGVTYGAVQFAANLPGAQQDEYVNDLLSKGYAINFVQFEQGTVAPPAVYQKEPPDRYAGIEHMHAFDRAYLLESVRDWLFMQNKLPVDELYKRGNDARAAKNEELAFYYYLQAARLGHMMSQMNVAAAYFNGGVVKRNYAEAARMFQIAWDNGDIKAPRYLGIMYEEGLDVPIDYTKAMEYYLAGVTGKDITSAARIGALYEKGLGVAQSYEKALEWYRIAAPSPEEAAKNASPRIIALLALGNFYENGLGVEKDITQAIVWYRVAAEGGNEDAKMALKRLGVQ
jgi:TPR repeat protein/predicted esterase